MKLHFTIGPVQELVRQSRRTRDLWASSFLLSYLSGCAMAGAAAKGQIVLPQAEADPLFQLIQSKSNAKSTNIGSLPNRFIIETDDPKGAAQAATKALNEKWAVICSAVWDAYLKPIAMFGDGTEEIFRRQVESFWEIQWVVTSDERPEPGLLQRRKAWRTRIPTIEPGDKCSVMPQLQELSGHVRARDSESRRSQQAFWQAIKGDPKSQNYLHDAELRPNERLSAIALVKRLYPRSDIAKKALGWDPEASRWRSTVYVAAIPWIEEVIKIAPDKCSEYAALVLQHDKRAQKEIDDRRSSRSRLEGQAGRFARLDGNYFFADALKNPNATLSGVDVDASARKELQRQLLALYRAGGKSPVGPPASFYGLLLMDGDHVGNLLRDPNGPNVSDALAEFTGQVQKIVERHQGYTIYAGGDDVLAMLPVPQTLACAWKLRDAYQSSFQGKNNATTSAAVVFANIRQPIRLVLQEAHDLLDNVAKDRNGRDSIAVTVMRGGAKALEWASTWDSPNTKAPRWNDLERLSNELRPQTTTSEATEVAPQRDEFSTGLLYRLQSVFGLLCGWPQWKPGDCMPFEGGDPLKLVAAEIYRSLDKQSGSDKRILDPLQEQTRQRKARELAQLFLEVCYPATRSGNQPVLDMTRLGMDGPLLSLFLSTDGKERDHGSMDGVSS